MVASRIFRGIFLALILLAIIVCGITYSHLSYGPTKFDKEIWLAGGADFSMDAPRLRMADGLIRDGKLIGMTRGEVDALLGSPTKTGYFRDYDYVYWLGRERSSFINIDSEWLLLDFDANGKLNEARIAHD